MGWAWKVSNKSAPVFYECTPWRAAGGSWAFTAGRPAKNQSQGEGEGQTIPHPRTLSQSHWWSPRIPMATGHLLASRELRAEGGSGKRPSLLSSRVLIPSAVDQLRAGETFPFQSGMAPGRAGISKEALLSRLPCFPRAKRKHCYLFRGQNKGGGQHRVLGSSINRGSAVQAPSRLLGSNPCCPFHKRWSLLEGWISPRAGDFVAMSPFPFSHNNCRMFPSFILFLSFLFHSDVLYWLTSDALGSQLPRRERDLRVPPYFCFRFQEPLYCAKLPRTRETDQLTKFCWLIVCWGFLPLASWEKLVCNFLLIYFSGFGIKIMLAL